MTRNKTKEEIVCKKIINSMNIALGSLNGSFFIMSLLEH